MDRYIARREVFERIAGTSTPPTAGRSKVRIGDKCVHSRFCSENPSSPAKYKFNINDNTLSADYELWICGHSSKYYLIPTAIMERIYNHPDAYIDNHHPAIRVVTVDIERHRATYASGGESLDLSSYYRTVISQTSC